MQSRKKFSNAQSAAMKEHLSGLGEFQLTREATDGESGEIRLIGAGAGVKIRRSDIEGSRKEPGSLALEP